MGRALGVAMLAVVAEADGHRSALLVGAVVVVVGALVTLTVLRRPAVALV